MEFLGFVGLNNLKVGLSTSRPDTPTVCAYCMELYMLPGALC